MSNQTDNTVDATSNGRGAKMGAIGKGVRIKGSVKGREDLVVEGEVEGTIHLPDNHLVLDRFSRTKAEVHAETTTICGRHRGNASASEKLELSSDAVLIGNLKAPRLVIHEGARYLGLIEMDVPLPDDLAAELGAANQPGAVTEPDTRQASEAKAGKKKKTKQAE